MADTKDLWTEYQFEKMHERIREKMTYRDLMIYYVLLIICWQNCFHAFIICLLFTALFELRRNAVAIINRSQARECLHQMSQISDPSDHVQFAYALGRLQMILNPDCKKDSWWHFYQPLLEKHEYVQIRSHLEMLVKKLF